MVQVEVAWAEAWEKPMPNAKHRLTSMLIFFMTIVLD
jgi:hypothetical protein